MTLAIEKANAEFKAQKESAQIEVLPTITNGIRVLIYACERAIKQNLVVGQGKKNITNLSLFLNNWLSGRNALDAAQKKQFKDWTDSSNAIVQSILELGFQIQPMLKDYFFDRLDNLSLQMQMNTYICNAQALEVALKTLGFTIESFPTSYKATLKNLTIDVTNGNIAYINCLGLECKIHLWEYKVGEVMQILEPLIFKQS